MVSRSGHLHVRCFPQIWQKRWVVPTCFTPSNSKFCNFLFLRHTAASVKKLSILVPVWLEAFPFSRQIRVYVTSCYSSYKWIQCPKYSGNIVVGAVKELHGTRSGQKVHPIKPRSADCHFLSQLVHRMAKCWCNFYKILLNSFPSEFFKFQFRQAPTQRPGGKWCRKSPLLAYKSNVTQIQMQLYSVALNECGMTAIKGDRIRIQLSEMRCSGHFDAVTLMKTGWRRNEETMLKLNALTSD